MIAYKTEIQKGVGVVGRKKEKKIDLNNLTPEAVSYTHLDVYKRQELLSAIERSSSAS